MFDSLSLWGAQLHGQLNRCVDRRSGRASEWLKLAFAEPRPAERVPGFQHLEIHRLRVAPGICYREHGLPQPQCAPARFLRTAHSAEQNDDVGALNRDVPFFVAVVDEDQLPGGKCGLRSEEHTSELQSRENLV